MQQSVPNLSLKQLAILELLRLAWASWEPCEECVPNCLDCVSSDGDEDSYSMTCQCCVNNNNYRPRFKYCSECGRPLT